MDLLDQIDNPILKEDLKNYINSLHNEINDLKQKLTKSQLSVTRTKSNSSCPKCSKLTSPLINRTRGSSPAILRRNSIDLQFQIKTGWNGEDFIIQDKCNIIVINNSTKWKLEEEINVNDFSIEELKPTVDNISWYRKYFLGREHFNYIVENSPYTPAFISLIQEYNGSKESAHIRIIIRTTETVRRLLIPLGSTNYNGDNWSNILKVTDEALEDATFRLDKRTLLSERLAEFEQRQISTQFKFGVLYCKQGQTTELEMYSNTSYSRRYSKFLKLLGDKIKLKGWKQYNGGLDTSTNLTGTRSIYTEWNGYSIMFHCSHLLPHKVNDAEFIEKKRHIGNDVVLIVFQEAGCEPFNPLCIQSTFVHAIIVIRVDDIRSSNLQYRVSVCTKEHVPGKFNPRLPKPSLFSHNEHFREFILCKCINAEYACYEGNSVLGKRLQKTRGKLLEQLYNDFKLAEKTKRTILH